MSSSGDGEQDPVPIDVYISSENSDEDVLIMSISKTSPFWENAVAEVGRMKEPFRIIIRSLPNAAEDFIAIDDTLMTSCALPKPDPDSCDDTKFKCNNGKKLFDIHKIVELLMNSKIIDFKY